MNSLQPFSDHKIRQTIEALKSDGQNITPWAVQSRLGGGDFLRIQQIIEQPEADFNGDEDVDFTDLQNATPISVKNMRDKNDKAANTHSSKTAPSQEMSANAELDSVDSSEPAVPKATPPKTKANLKPAKPKTSKAKPVEIIDKQMPTTIEATMFRMQSTLSKMANELWNDAVVTAQEKAEITLAGALQAQEEAERAYANIQQAHEDVKKSNQQMQEKITALETHMKVLDVDYKKTLSALDQDRQKLQQVSEERDSLQKNVQSLEQENQQLDHKAFSANIQAAKAEGLADIIKEQLELAKQAEKQTQTALDRSERKVSEYHREMHNANQTLRDEMRDRQVPMHPLNRELQSPAQLQQQYPPQELPRHPIDLPPVPDAARPLSPVKPAPVAPTHIEIQSESVQEADSYLDSKVTVTQVQKVSQPKTRSLSTKLFDRKKLQPKNKKK
ncbi:MAG: hypothetical protein V7784_03770 [Oceanospirillaceae bacterium]